MIVWGLYNNGNGDGTQVKNCYVKLGFRLQDYGLCFVIVSVHGNRVWKDSKLRDGLMMKMVTCDDGS
jgi:hypothetical protein